MFRLTKTLLLCLSVGATAAFAQISSVGLSMDSGSWQLTGKDGATLLSGGTTAAGDGFALQVGYYSAATAGDLFAGTWTPVAGAGTALFSNLSIGDLSDNGADAGSFAFSLTFTAGTAGLPNAGQIMAIRFFDSTSVASAAFYGVASNSSWNWVAPNFPPTVMNFSLDDSGVSWLGGVAGTTATSVVIPETSTYAAILGALTLGVVGVRRWRKSAK